MEKNPDPLSDIIIDFLMSKSRETPELDFKYTIDISKKGDFPKIAKDIFAFSNYGGGHILLGFFEKETGSIEASGLPYNFHIDQADLQEKFNSYSNEPIELGYREFQRKIDGKIKAFAAIYIPGSQKILKAIKTGTLTDEHGNTKTVFELGDTLYRRGTQSIKASYEEMKYIEKRASEVSKRILLLSGEPDLINENIFSNLFPVTSLPETLYTIISTDPSILTGLDPVITYYETNGTIYTFDDGLSHVLDQRLLKNSRSEKTCDVLGSGRENLITATLNKEVSSHCKNLGLRSDRRHTYFYPTNENELKKTWESKYRTSTRLVAQRWYFNKLKKTAYWHLAADITFTKIGEDYYLNILPRVILTEDGYRVMRGFDEGTIITSLSYNWYNKKYLNDVLFWLSQLDTKSGSSFKINNTIEVSKEPASFNLPYGIKSDRPSMEFRDRQSELYFIEGEIE